MNAIKFIHAFLMFVICSCKQNTGKQIVESEAVQLNNQAIKLVAFMNNPDSSGKAISLLDKATTIDSNYFLGHYNKLMFYNQLKQFDKAILTVNKLIQLRPSAHDLYMTCGLLYERKGDTLSSRWYFEKSLAICNSVIDTMSNTNRDYEMLVVNKAINLIMLGDQINANELLKKVHDIQSDKELRKWTAYMMNIDKKELLQLLAGDQYSH